MNRARELYIRHHLARVAKTTKEAISRPIGCTVASQRQFLILDLRSIKEQIEKHKQRYSEKYKLLCDVIKFDLQELSSWMQA